MSQDSPGSNESDTRESDALLNQLGQLERDRLRDESSLEEWEAMARGERVPADPELAAAMAPIGGARKAAMLDGLIAALAAEPPDEAHDDGEPDVVAPVVSLQERRAKRGWLVPLVAVAAAAIVAAVVWPSSNPPSIEPPVDAVPALPAYRGEWHSGDRQLRGGAESVAEPSFAVGSRVEWVLRPAERLRDGVEPALRAWRARDGSDFERWDAPFERAPGGAVRLAGRAGELFGEEPAAWTVVVAIGDEAAMPSAAPTDSGGRAFQVVRASLRTTGSTD